MHIKPKVLCVFMIAGVCLTPFATQAERGVGLDDVKAVAGATGEVVGSFARGVADSVAPETTRALDGRAARAINGQTTVTNSTITSDVKVRDLTLEGGSQAALGNVLIDNAEVQGSTLETTVSVEGAQLEGSSMTAGVVGISGGSTINNSNIHTNVELNNVQARNRSSVTAGGVIIGN